MHRGHSLPAVPVCQVRQRRGDAVLAWPPRRPGLRGPVRHYGRLRSAAPRDKRRNRGPDLHSNLLLVGLILRCGTTSLTEGQGSQEFIRVPGGNGLVLLGCRLLEFVPYLPLTAGWAVGSSWQFLHILADFSEKMCKTTIFLRKQI